jgi:UDP-glucose 4-epimerase
MIKILITGGQGFIGGRLAKYLSNNKNYEIIVTSRNPIISKNNHTKCLRVDANVDNLIEVVKGCHTVIHLAALDANSCIEKPYDAIDVNIGNTLKWRIAADKAAVKKFIYFSTIHVYGNSNTNLLNEESLPIPTHPYAITHRVAEDFVLSPIYNQNSESIVFRLSNSFGYPVGQISQWHVVILDFCKQAVEKNIIVINNNSSQSRDFISLTNVCKCVDFSLMNNLTAGIYNLGSGVNKTLLEVAILIKEISLSKFNQSIEIVEKIDAGSIKSANISIQKLNIAGFTPTSDMEIEISSLLEYCKKIFTSAW